MSSFCFVGSTKRRKNRTPAYFLPHMIAENCVDVALGFNRFVKHRVRGLAEDCYKPLVEESAVTCPAERYEDNDDVDVFLSDYTGNPNQGKLAQPLFSLGITLGENGAVDQYRCLSDRQISGAIEIANSRLSVVIPDLKNVVKVQHFSRVGAAQAAQLVNLRMQHFYKVLYLTSN